MQGISLINTQNYEERQYLPPCTTAVKQHNKLEQVAVH